MAGNGFAISVRLIDLATGPLAKVNQSLVAVEKTAKKAAREGGLFEAKDALKKMRESATEVAEKLGTVFTPLSGLGAAGSLAGMVSLAASFARTGTEVARTSSLYGVGARDLQNWQGALRLAGGSAEDATGLIANVGRQLYLARNGLNPQIVRGASQFGLDINKSDIEFLLDAADKLKSLGPQQRRQFGQVFGIDENSIFILSKGRQEVERYIAIAKQHGYLTQDQIRGASDLTFAWQGLKESVESTGNAIGADIGKWLTPMLVKWSEWLDRARETPETMKAVQLGVDALAVVLGVTAVGAIAKLTLSLVAFNARMLTTLARSRLLLALNWAAMAYAVGNAAPEDFDPNSDKNRKKRESLEKGANDATGGWFDRIFGWPKRWHDNMFGQPDAASPPAAYAPIPPQPAPARPWWQRLGQFFNPISAAGASTPPMSAPAAASDAVRPIVGPSVTRFYTGSASAHEAEHGGFNFAGIRHPESGFRTYPNEFSGVADAAQLLRSYGRRGYDTLDKIINRWAPPNENNTEQLISRAEQWTGFKRGQQLNLEDPKTLTSVLDAMNRNEFGGNRTVDPDRLRGHVEQYFRETQKGVAGASKGAAGAADEMLSMRGMDNVKDRSALDGYLNSAGNKLDVGVSAWCAAFVNAALTRQGIAGSGSDVATDFAKWGESVAGNAVQKGDVLVKMRGLKPGARGGHVGMATGNVDPTTGQIEMVQGNTGGRVDTTWEDPAELTKRRAPYAAPVESAGAALNRAAEPAEAADSTHHVEVQFKNAPAGMRSGLTRADGPASVAVRTQHALDMVY